MPFKLESDFHKVITRVKRVRDELPDTRKAGMRAVGIQVVAWAVQDFRARGLGQTAGGVRWRPITRSAIRSRLAKRSAWRSISSSLERMTDQERPLREELRRKMPKGGSADQRGAIAHRFEEANPLIGKNRKRRKGLKTRRNAMVEREFASHTIGVDTGRLVNSLVFGQPDLAKLGAGRLRAGTPAPPKATFAVREDSIEAGSNLSYAKDFDKLRPIFPTTMINQAREKELEELVADVHEEQLKNAVEDSTP